MTELTDDAVKALRKERDEAAAQNDRLWAANHNLVAEQDALAAELAAAQQQKTEFLDRVEKAIKDTMLRLGKHPDIRRIMAPQVMWGAGDSCISAIRAALAEVQADARREGGE